MVSFSLSHFFSSNLIQNPMASSLHTSPTTFLKPVLNRLNTSSSTATATATATATRLSIQCGGGSRGPLVKGRVLSIEAIQAVQSLKRSDEDPTVVSKTLSRLIKSDLVATLKELLRQDQCHLALHAFSVFRSEYPPADLSLYADVALALARNGLHEKIDCLVCELENEFSSGGGGVQWGSSDKKGVIRLIRAVIGADRRESTVRIYEMLKRNGWGSSADEYMVRTMSKGLRRLGEVELAYEVDVKFGSLHS